MSLNEVLFSQPCRDLPQEGQGIHPFFVRQGRERVQVAGHDALLDGADGGSPQPVGKSAKILQTVQLRPLAQRARPRKNRSYAVGGGGLPFEMPVIVAGDGAVGRFVLILTVGGRLIFVFLVETGYDKDGNRKPEDNRYRNPPEQRQKR